MRYKLTASFNTEMRKGFVTTSLLEKEFDTAKELSDAGMSFLARYNSDYCHGLKYYVEESK